MAQQSRLSLGGYPSRPYAPFVAKIPAVIPDIILSLFSAIFQDGARAALMTVHGVIVTYDPDGTETSATAMVGGIEHMAEDQSKGRRNRESRIISFTAGEFAHTKGDVVKLSDGSRWQLPEDWNIKETPNLTTIKVLKEVG